jgi:hypothetical protein
MKQLVGSQNEDLTTIQTATMREVSHAVAELSKFNTSIDGLRDVVSEGMAAGMANAAKSQSVAPVGQQKIEVVNKVPNIFLDIIRNQFRVLQTWMDPILKLAEMFPDAEGLQKAASATERNYAKLIKQIGDTQTEQQSDTD